MTVSDSPLPMNGGLGSMADNLRDRARAAYSHAFNDILDRLLEDFILPSDRVSLLHDIAQFTTFLCATKIVETQHQQPTREMLMAAYWPMQKSLKDEVPDMLRALAGALAAEPTT